MKHIENFDNFLNEDAGAWIPTSITPELLSAENVGYLANLLIKLGPVNGIAQLKKIYNVASKNPAFDECMDNFSNVVDIFIDEFPELGDDNSELQLAVVKATSKIDIEEREKKLKISIEKTKEDVETLLDIIHAMETELKDMESNGKSAIGKSDRYGHIGGDSKRRYYNDKTYNRRITGKNYVG